MVLAVGVKYLLERFAPATPMAVETWVAGLVLLLAVVVVASAIPALRALWRSARSGSLGTTVDR